MAAVTSLLARTQTDVFLTDWIVSRLRVGSTVRLARLDCLEQKLLIKKLGDLLQADAIRLKETSSQYIKP